MLVLDGLDELREDLWEGFLPLIQSKVFANVYLMLTARHEAGMKVRRYCDTLLEIVGYTQEDVESCIKKYLSRYVDESVTHKMIKKIGQGHLIQRCCVFSVKKQKECFLRKEPGCTMSLCRALSEGILQKEVFF